MTSGIAIHKSNAGQLAGIDARLSRALNCPASGRRAAVPKTTLRERLRRLLLIGVPVMLAAADTAYYLADMTATQRDPSQPACGLL